MNPVVVLLLILVMVGFNALYVAAEFATVGSRRSRVQESAEGGSGPAEGLLAILPVLDFTSETARVHAEIHASLRQRGALIGAHDLIIAATALQHGYALLTSNEREFGRVPGLQVLTTGT